MNLKIKNNGNFEDLVIRGLNGSDGQDGKSAYELAKDAGFEGTEAEWLESLKGADGKTTTSTTATVSTSAWAEDTSISGYTYKATVSISGVTDNSNIIVGLASNSTAEQEEDCGSAGVQCKGQGEGTIDLYAKSIPTMDLTINVMILS